MAVMPTPKQPQAERHKDWYPYYAGYTEAFAAGAIDKYFTKATSIVDPWNGSGTTTTVGASKGIASFGIDINPVMSVVARARLVSVSFRESLAPLALEILVASDREVPAERTIDPFRNWLRRPAVSRLRSIQHAIHVVLAQNSDLEIEIAVKPNMAGAELPLLACFFYAALFATARDLLDRYRSSNPSWLRYPNSPWEKASPSNESIDQAFTERVAYLCERLTLPTGNQTLSATICTGNALDLKTDKNFDACLTSPPYATRVDYIRGSLAELAVLGVGEQQITALRSASTGTPIVKGSRQEGEVSVSSESGLRIINRVANHASHGSSNYYAPWIRRYLEGLDQSMGKISTAVSKRGRIGILVQDSYYKSEHIDLQQIVIEMMHSNGRQIVGREDFDVRHSIANMNSAARRHLKHRQNVESLLVFGAGNKR